MWGQAIRVALSEHRSTQKKNLLDNITSASSSAKKLQAHVTQLNNAKIKLPYCLENIDEIWTPNLKKFTENISPETKEVFSIVIFHEIFDALIRHINRTLVGIETPLQRLDDKLYGAISAGNLIFGGEIQDALNNAMNSIVSASGGGDKSSEQKLDEKNKVKESFKLGAATAACRRLLNDPAPGESQFLFPYVLRSLVSVVGPAENGPSKHFKDKLDNFSSLFSCSVDPAKERHETALALSRSNSLKNLTAMCEEFKKLTTQHGGTNYAYCTLGTDNTSAFILIDSSNETFIDSSIRRLGELSIAHDLRLIIEELEPSFSGTPTDGAKDEKSSNLSDRIKTYSKERVVPPPNKSAQANQAKTRSNSENCCVCGNICEAKVACSEELELCVKVLDLTSINGLRFRLRQGVIQTTAQQNQTAGATQ